ncbi:MAG: hypothetical protein JXQ65_15765 [Candidatus Marinimicrobia bacterium]|nr:hypothetical protein [Candidatus Neomarinimicrobiota bacterium]
MKKCILLLLCIVTTLFFCSKKEQHLSTQDGQPKAIWDTIPPLSTDTLSTTSIPKPEPQDTQSSETSEVREIKDTNARPGKMDFAILWQKYREAREKSKEALSNSEFHQALDHLKAAAIYAEKLDRGDLAAWQYNNIGYYSIQEFKGVTNYDYRMHHLRSISDKNQKEQYLSETKKIFSKNINLLTTAESYLKNALKIDEHYHDQDRTEKINSNLNFIIWVNNFLTNQEDKNGCNR